MNTPRAALYARVSTEDQDEALQLDALKRLAEYREWEVIGAWVDHGVSSRQKTRAGLEAMLEACRKGEVDVVAVWRFDRFARSTLELTLALDEFNALGINFVSVTEAIDTSTPTGKMVFTVIGAMAEFERSIIAERTRAGIQAAVARGSKPGAPVTVDINMELAEKLIASGLTLAQASKELGVSRWTLRHRCRKLRLLQGGKK